MKVRVFTLKERNHNMKRKIALVVGSTFLCASILSGCASATPVDKYLRSFDKGDSEAASQIYSEEIKDNAEDKEALQTKLKERMDSIYENFKSGKITSDEAKEKLKSYKEYDTSSVYAFTTINKVTTLQKSKDAYSIMGSYKTSAAINYINQHPDHHYLYVSPLLSECSRIQEDCPSLDFKQPDDTGAIQSKSGDLLRLLREGFNVAISHELFKLLREDAMDYIRDYCLILDEELSTIEPHKVTLNDLEIMQEQELLQIDPDTKQLIWLNDSYKGDYKRHMEAVKRQDLFELAQNQVFWMGRFVA